MGDLFDMHGWKWPEEWTLKFSGLLEILVPNSTKIDKLIWLDTDGSIHDFSVSMAWNSIRHRDLEISWEKVVWFSNYVPRHDFLLWLIMRNNLQTQDMLKHWDFSSATVLCVFCKTQPDSNNHLFFECDYSRQVQLLLCPLANLQTNVIIGSEVVKSLEPIAKKNSLWSIVGRIVLGAVAYYFWQERNNHLYNRGARTCDQLLRDILDTVRLKLSSLQLKDEVEAKHILSKWKLLRSLSQE